MEKMFRMFASDLLNCSDPNYFCECLCPASEENGGECFFNNGAEEDCKEVIKRHYEKKMQSHDYLVEVAAKALNSLADNVFDCVIERDIIMNNQEVVGLIKDKISQTFKEVVNLYTENLGKEGE